MLLVPIARPIYRTQKMCSGEMSVHKHTLCVMSWLEVLRSVPVDVAIDILQLGSSKSSKERELADS
jgi:hypothetical protein